MADVQLTKTPSGSPLVVSPDADSTPDRDLGRESSRFVSDTIAALERAGKYELKYFWKTPGRLMGELPLITLDGKEIARFQSQEVSGKTITTLYSETVNQAIGLSDALLRAGVPHELSMFQSVADALAGFSAWRFKISQPLNPINKQITPEAWNELRANARKSVAQIDAYADKDSGRKWVASGTGFITARNGDTYYLLTNAHVADDDNLQYHVTFLDGKSYDATIVRHANERDNPDLARLQFKSPNDYIPIEEATRKLQEGEVVMIAGFPSGIGGYFDMFARAYPSWTNCRDNAHGLPYSGDLAVAPAGNTPNVHGLSGGVILDMDGKYHAVFASTFLRANLECAVDQDNINEFYVDPFYGRPEADFQTQFKYAHDKDKQFCLELENGENPEPPKHSGSLRFYIDKNADEICGIILPKTQKE